MSKNWEKGRRKIMDGFEEIKENERRIKEKGEEDLLIKEKNRRIKKGQKDKRKGQKYIQEV